MMHAHRTWSITDATGLSPEELADAFTQRSWTLCSAWRRGPVAYFNDSTSEDGAFELAVVEIDHETPQEIVGRQFESVTFGWCTPERAAEYIRQFDDPVVRAGLLRQYASPVVARLHPPEERCPACA